MFNINGDLTIDNTGLKLNQLTGSDINSATSNYVKFNNGFAMCWGVQNAPSDFRHNTTKDIYVSFPITFKSNPSILLGLNFSNSGSMDYIKVQNGTLYGDGMSTTNGFIMRFRNNATATSGMDFGGNSNWLAIGYWK